MIQANRTIQFIRETEFVPNFEELFTVATAATDVGVWEWNIADAFFYAHPVLLDLLGLGDRDLPGDLYEWLLNVHPSDQKRVTTLTQRFLNGELAEIQDIRRMLDKAGRTRHFYCRAVPITCSSGVPQRVIGVEVDVTGVIN